MTAIAPQHLLIFISSLSLGGAERVTVNLANHWAGKGWLVTVVTLSNGSDDFFELEPRVRRVRLGLLRLSSNFVLATSFWVCLTTCSVF
jgi:GalNAc-alpha-(1->4)-GalNAc-alpha-(1->3)-diNAcBac-PP-undecaprenol alpha-1,4-N-acetyl-D-galactosaminyltransferase